MAKLNHSLDIPFLDYKDRLIIRKSAHQMMIYDPIRKKEVIMQQEEFVRQLVIQYFIGEKIYPASRMAVEKGIVIDGQIKRFDILVFDKQGKPFLLVECKSFDVALSNSSVRQIAVYNQSLHCPYLLLTNGQESMLCQIDFESSQVHYLNNFPLS